MNNLITKSVNLLLKESPDLTFGPAIGPNDKKLQWYDSDAIPFGVFHTGHIAIGDSSLISSNHTELMFVLRRAANLSKGNVFFFHDLMEKDLTLFPMADGELIDYLNSLEQYPDRTDYKYSGRYWYKSNVISFWSKINEIPINEFETIINDLLEELPLNKRTLKVDFVDLMAKSYNDLVSYQDIINPNKNINIESKLSQKELEEILKKAHVKPWELNKKEKEIIDILRDNFKGSQINYNRAKKLGFETTVEYKYWLSKMRERGLTNFSFKEYYINKKKKKKKKIDKLDQYNPSYITYEQPPLNFTNVTQPSGGAFSGTG